MRWGEASGAIGHLCGHDAVGRWWSRTYLFLARRPPARPLPSFVAFARLGAVSLARPRCRIRSIVRVVRRFDCPLRSLGSPLLSPPLYCPPLHARYSFLRPSTLQIYGFFDSVAHIKDQSTSVWPVHFVSISLTSRMSLSPSSRLSLSRVSLALLSVVFALLLCVVSSLLPFVRARRG